MAASLLRRSGSGSGLKVTGGASRTTGRSCLKADPAFKNASDEKKKTFTPVPLAREMVRLSSALLFSKEPKFTNEAREDLLTRVLEANALGDFLLETGEYVATEGYGALRVIRDEEVSGEPLITWVAADEVIFPHPPRALRYRRLRCNAPAPEPVCR